MICERVAKLSDKSDLKVKVTKYTSQPKPHCVMWPWL